MLTQEGKCQSDDWEGLWAAYSNALTLDAGEVYQRVIGGWGRGVEGEQPRRHIRTDRGGAAVADARHWVHRREQGV